MTVDCLPGSNSDTMLCVSVDSHRATHRHQSGIDRESGRGLVGILHVSVCIVAANMAPRNHRYLAGRRPAAR